MKYNCCCVLYMCTSVFKKKIHVFYVLKFLYNLWINESKISNQKTI